MPKSPCRLACLCVLLSVVVPALGQSSVALPPVYLYHDDHYAGYGYLSAPKAITLTPDSYWPVTPGDAEAVGPNHRDLMAALGWALRDKGVAAQGLDASGWRDLCERGDRAVVVVIGQTIPDTVFSGRADGSPLKRWLQGGGIMVYSGDWPFYWYCDAAGKGHGEGAADRGMTRCSGRTW